MPDVFDNRAWLLLARTRLAEAGHEFTTDDFAGLIHTFFDEVQGALAERNVWLTKKELIVLVFDEVAYGTIKTLGKLRGQCDAKVFADVAETMYRRKIASGESF